MTSAAETFVTQCAHASKRANVYLRGMQKADRDEVINIALLDAWLKYSEFDAASMSLETWFGQRVRDARRDFKRSNRHVSSTDLAEAMAPDNVEYDAQMTEAAEGLEESLNTLTKRTIAAMLTDGATFKDICAAVRKPAGLVRTYIDRLRRLRDMLPTAPTDIARATPKATDPDKAHGGACKGIDHDIEKMLRRPVSERADCPVCWRCKYFDGLLPKNYKPPIIVEVEIQNAVHATELRKIEIAERVRE